MFFWVDYEDKTDIAYNPIPTYPWRGYGVRCIGYTIHNLVLFSLVC